MGLPAHVPSGDVLPGPGAPDDAAERWLLAHRRGTDADTALRFFDRCAAIEPEEVVGRWHGSGWHTGHPWDGLLEAMGWYGKDVDDPEHVRPTLFRDGRGDPVPVDPVLAPVSLIRLFPQGLRRSGLPAAFRAVVPLLRSPRPAGRIRSVQTRGVVSAALVYDAVPIVDALRRVAPDLLLGAADIRGEPAPLMFVLRRRRPAARG
ncbi:GXWXG domain-containing protein [Cellulomonas aerilata]|uniref:DUF4334 domain-containing protein n=1 Tax=Cellulomonas aerilata TaxID=515326 RepID=A0A512DCI7_9CELL|nr:GXWXG domain-containing protein [Cellulomonas aerilata]GEO34194.1 hypothetical protein CAE01nite_19190 [Cellulomonas aerilata]